MSEPRVESKDFHLRCTSPVIDRGTCVGGTQDFDGNPRPQGRGYDIGAYELPASRKVATPEAAHINEIITYTITVAGNGNPAAVIDLLLLQLFTWHPHSPIPVQ